MSMFNCNGRLICCSSVQKKQLTNLLSNAVQCQTKSIFCLIIPFVKVDCGIKFHNCFSSQFLIHLMKLIHLLKLHNYLCLKLHVSHTQKL